MSTIIGSNERFAVEYELQPLDNPEQMHWLPGRICFWIEGKKIGNYEEGAQLTVALATFSQLLRHQGNVRNERLLELPLVDAYQEIYSALYVDVGQPEEQVDQAWDEYSRFLAIPTGFDVFDRWMAFLVEDSERGRFMWRGPDDRVHEAWLVAGEFFSVLGAFLEHLEERTGQKRRAM
jgi:hypothetical protein